MDGHFLVFQKVSFASLLLSNFFLRGTGMTTKFGENPHHKRCLPRGKTRPPKRRARVRLSTTLFSGRWAEAHQPPGVVGRARARVR